MKSKLRGIFFEFTGCALLAFGICNFANAAEIPVTGISGISLIIYRLTKFPIGLSSILINIPIILFSYKTLGRSFFIRSIRCMIVLAFFTDYISPLLPMYEGNRLLAALCGGIFAGAGDALIYMQNSGTGGLDFVNMAIKYKYPHLELGNIIFGAAMAVIFVSGIIFRDVDSVIYGLIFSYITSAVVNRMMAGFNLAKFIIIMTDKGEECCQAIRISVNRGATVLEGYGSYTHSNKDVVLSACGVGDVFLLERAVKQTDPNSFLVVLDANEIHGEGFRNLVLGNTDKKQ